MSKALLLKIGSYVLIGVAAILVYKKVGAVRDLLDKVPGIKD